MQSFSVATCDDFYGPPLVIIFKESIFLIIIILPVSKKEEHEKRRYTIDIHSQKFNRTLIGLIYSTTHIPLGSSLC